MSPASKGQREPGNCRIDRWLWAARFFKTRALAAAAVEGGKVTVGGERVKRSRSLRAGEQVTIRLGPYQHQVVVERLSVHRGPASEAATLYTETVASRRSREQRALQLRSALPVRDRHAGRPTKKDRRALDRLRGREDR